MQGIARNLHVGKRQGENTIITTGRPLKNTLKFIQRLKASLYVRNVATLAGGTTFAQAISVFTAPILYRIYSKVDYGTLGLYMAIVGVVGVFSTFQYFQPILLEKNDDDAKKVMWLNRLINLVTTLAVLLLVLLFGDNLSRLLGNEKLMPWLYLAPISIFFSGQGQIFGIWANRKKKYKILSFNTILTAVLVPLVSITIGLYNNGPLGLFLGLLISHVVPPIVLLIRLTKYDDLGLKYFDWEVIKGKAKEHKNFPSYTLPSAFINRLTNQLPVFMLSAYAGPAVVGVYNLCVRMLGLPINLIGNAITRVFQQKAVEEYNERGDFKNVFVKTFKTLSLIAIPGLILILILGPKLFSFVFGPEWRESGVFAQILIIMFALKLIISPLSYAFYIKKKLKEDMFLHLYILVSMVIIFLIGFNTTDNHKNVILLYAINYCLIYSVYLTRAYNLSKK
ncbi:lipopolysaccharide biosynthesis protein [Winogradskyella flava]|uniref:Oligosaccharide flippase family protein n=1 Tax=Winogradskyella flava TaxID=1884876 RepID=A0A842IQJ4_9FLAO|nr:oligosaccharide flippase family protein [Winogradskyella flava]MBC2844479.1 oligosaccharide flippase family protein [Winogradskyella flava]